MPATVGVTKAQIIHHEVFWLFNVVEKNFIFKCWAGVEVFFGGLVINSFLKHWNLFSITKCNGNHTVRIDGLILLLGFEI